MRPALLAHAQKGSKRVPTRAPRHAPSLTMLRPKPPPSSCWANGRSRQAAALLLYRARPGPFGRFTPCAPCWQLTTADRLCFLFPLLSGGVKQGRESSRVLGQRNGPRSGSHCERGVRQPFSRTAGGGDHQRANKSHKLNGRREQTRRGARRDSAHARGSPNRKECAFASHCARRPGIGTARMTCSCSPWTREAISSVAKAIRPTSAEEARIY